MVISESGLDFIFDDSYDVVKFDDTDFYRKYFSAMPEGKGVDILGRSDDVIFLIEIKNCTGDEHNNTWRTGVDNSLLNKVKGDQDIDGRESLDIEMAKKTAMTFDCIYGSWTVSKRVTDELSSFWKDMTSTKIQNDKKTIMVMLFLEGDFNTRTRTKKAMMSRIQDSIKKKLRWLNCKISVVDTKTYNNRYFEVKKRF